VITIQQRVLILIKEQYQRKYQPIDRSGCKGKSMEPFIMSQHFIFCSFCAKEDQNQGRSRCEFFYVQV
jgi:hypothetical protein